VRAPRPRQLHPVAAKPRRAAMPPARGPDYYVRRRQRSSGWRRGDPGLQAGEETPLHLPGNVDAARYCVRISWYRLLPTPAQETVLRDHRGHARFVWNLAVEQHRHWRPGGDGIVRPVNREPQLLLQSA
jgi:hypothetical protein